MIKPYTVEYCCDALGYYESSLFHNIVADLKDLDWYIDLDNNEVDLINYIEYSSAFSSTEDIEFVEELVKDIYDE